MHLIPSDLNRLVMAGKYDELGAYHILDCIEGQLLVCLSCETVSGPVYPDRQGCCEKECKESMILKLAGSCL